jgi:hypothetical protein
MPPLIAAPAPAARGEFTAHMGVDSGSRSADNLVCLRQRWELMERPPGSAVGYRDKLVQVIRGEPLHDFRETIVRGHKFAPAGVLQCAFEVVPQLADLSSARSR